MRFVLQGVLWRGLPYLATGMIPEGGTVKISKGATWMIPEGMTGKILEGATIRDICMCVRLRAYTDTHIS